MYTITDLYDLDHTLAADYLKGFTYPWEALKGIKELILDFANLEYISSAGLRVLLSAQKIMNKQGKMTIKNVCDEIKEIFEVTGFSDILTVV